MTAPTVEAFEAPKIPQRPTFMQAHCDACGHNWKLAQHERFVCPYCYNEPTQVEFKGSYVVLADEASRRWFT